MIAAAAAAAFSVIRALPLPVCFALGRWLGLVSWVVLPGYRRLVRENILRALGPGCRPGRLARQHFMTLGANGLSAIKIPVLTEEEITRIAPIEGLEHIRESIARGQGVVLAINHIGNWELYAQLVYRVPEARFGTVYQALRNREIDELINRDRRRLGVLTFDRKKGFHEAISLLREPGILGILVDQNAGDGGMWTPFFGRLASTSTLAATLAQRTGSVVLPVAITTAGFARWKVVVSPPLDTSGDDIGPLTARINQALEAQILSSPPDWFWVHNRWKTPHPNFLTTGHKRGVYIPPETSAMKPFSIVVRSPNWLGDAVMAVPAVRALKAGRPDARVTVACPEKLVAMWKYVEGVDEVVPLKKNIFSAAWRLRRGFDVAVILPHSLRSAIEAWLAGIPRRVGYAGHCRDRLLNQVYRPKRKEKVPRPLHQADRYLALVRWCGGEDPAPLAPVWKKREEIILAVCPGAEYGPAKRWPAEKFRNAMERISRRIECRWVIVGAAGDIPVAAGIASGFRGSVENLAGKTSLDQLIETLLGCRAVLTNDTGTMHLADLLGVPLIAIFGSTEPQLTGPRAPTSRVLRHHAECSPCFLRTCPLDLRCMNGLRPEDVAEELLGLIPEAPPRIIPRSPPPDRWRKTK
ncbi:MAG: hypothetical protein Fur0032_07950 [Terrimicrobiaceae bacterium]